MAEPRQRRTASLIVVLAAMAAGAACGEQDGESGHFPGTVPYDSADGAFHFHYLSPPWIPIKLPGTSTTIFVVPPEEIRVITTETDAPFSLRIEAVGAAPDAAIQSSAGMVVPPVSGERIHDVRSPRGTTVGREMSWQETTGAKLYRREAYLSGAQAAASFRMRFTARRDIATDAMIGQMIGSFEPRPSAAEVHAP